MGGVSPGVFWARSASSEKADESKMGKRGGAYGPYTDPVLRVESGQEISETLTVFQRASESRG